MNGTKESVKRVSSYRRVLYKLKSLGFVKVFSDNLGDALGISPAQVRKDFSDFDLTGNKRGGYIVSDLLEKLNKILNKNELQKVIIVGCGKMGSALMNYQGFSGEGIKIAAGFDADPEKIDPEARVPILDLTDMADFVRKNKIKVAIMTVPETAAAKVFDTLESAGVKGILNFAPLLLKSTDKCVVNNINIALELENMFYFVNNSE